MNSTQAYLTLKAGFSWDVEELWAVALRPNKEIIAEKCLFRGTVDYCMAHPRDIFRFALLNNSSYLLLAHNHPSGDLNPSTKDIEFTEQIIAASQLIEISILDHIIFGKNSYWSFANNGWKFH